MQSEAEMMGGPPRRALKSVHVGFRCPVELEQWVHSMAGDGASKTDGFVWALEQGKDFVEAAGPDLAGKLDGYAAITGSQRVALLKKVLELGMAQFERELRNGTRK